MAVPFIVADPADAVSAPMPSIPRLLVVIETCRLAFDVQRFWWSFREVAKQLGSPLPIDASRSAAPRLCPVGCRMRKLATYHGKPQYLLLSSDSE